MPSRSPLCSILFRGGSTRPPIAGRRGEVGPTLDRRYPARLRSFQKQPERSARLQPTSIESGHSPSAYTSVRSSVSWSDSTNVIPSSNCGRSYPPIRRALSVDSTSGWNVYRLPSNFRSSRSAAIDWTDRRASVLSPSTTTRRSMSLALSASPRATLPKRTTPANSATSSWSPYRNARIGWWNSAWGMASTGSGFVRRSRLICTC